jgi:hypothetical protein
MKRVTQINVLTIKPGKIDDFIEVDRRFYASNSLPEGLIGGRLFNSLDGRFVVRVSEYHSIRAQEEVLKSESVRQQINTLRPLVESSNPALYEEVTNRGISGKQD